MELVITAGNLNVFQKSLRPLFHSLLQLFNLLHSLLQLFNLLHYANHHTHTHTQGNELSDHAITKSTIFNNFQALNSVFKGFPCICVITLETFYGSFINYSK